MSRIQDRQARHEYSRARLRFRLLDLVVLNMVSSFDLEVEVVLWHSWKHRESRSFAVTKPSHCVMDASMHCAQPIATFQALHAGYKYKRACS